MYTFIYNLYFYLKRKQKKRKENAKKPLLITQKIIDRIEWFYNILVRDWYMKHPIRRNGINQAKRKESIIVSLTSYPKRIGTVWLTIETLLRQSVKPDEIILWLAQEQFKSIDVLPRELIELQKYGLTIRFCDDLRSHKKYYYVMQEYPEDIIILVDDDMFYPRDTIKKLMQMHKKYPYDICTMTAQAIKPSFESKPSMWRNPKLDEKFEHSDEIQIFTGSGSLYPPHSLDEEVFNKELVKSICPSADDLWLTFMANRKRTRITTCFPWRAFPVTIYGTAEGSLWYMNAEEGQNDVQWEAMLMHFLKG
ncbi:MAG: glycosyltransferase [Oliverpabstia sp.]